MSASMLSMMLLLFLSIVSSQMVPMCAATTASQCTVTFTAEGTSQVGPTSTIWADIMTTYLNAIDCRYCKIDNVPFNPSQKGPFRTKITSPMMTVTEVGCMPETTAITGREFHGYGEAAPIEVSTTARRHLPHVKRQNTTNPISGSGLPLQTQFYLTQISTAIYVIDLINIGSNLNGTCQDLRSGENDTQDAAIAINITQAADFVCAAYAANLTYIDPSLVQIFAAALYAIEIAGNFTGTTNTTALCSSIDVDILTLPIFGIDGQGVQSYVCNAYNASLTTTFSTATSTATSTASAGTTGPIGWGNQTSFGTSPIITGASTGTGVSGRPFGNYTGTRTKPGSGHTQPAGTGLPQSSLLGPTAQSGSGYDQPTATDGPGSPYSSNPASSTETGSEYNQPTGTDVSGWLHGSLIGFPTESDSGYVQPTGTAVSGYAQLTGTGASDDPFGIQFSSFEPLSSARLPPNPSTLHYYPTVSPSTSHIVFYGYGYHG